MKLESCRIFINFDVTNGIGIDRFVMHGYSDSIGKLYLFQHPQMHPVSVSMHHTHSVLSGQERSWKPPRGDLKYLHRRHMWQIRFSFNGKGKNVAIFV